MSDSNHRSSVTDWVLAESRGLDASRKLWERYTADVIRACEARLSRNQKRSISAEDLAQEVFHDFFLGLRAHSFTRLKDRRDVHQILVMLINRISIDHRRRHEAVKAGSGRVVAFADLDSSHSTPMPAWPDTIPASPSAPADEAELRRLLLSLFPSLTDPRLQDLVCDRIMGCTIGEIASNQGMTEHQVSRKLQLLIRQLRSRFQSAR